MCVLHLRHERETMGMSTLTMLLSLFLNIHNDKLIHIFNSYNRSIHLWHWPIYGVSLVCRCMVLLYACIWYLRHLIEKGNVKIAEIAIYIDSHQIMHTTYSVCTMHRDTMNNGINHMRRGGGVLQLACWIRVVIYALTDPLCQV